MARFVKGDVVVVPFPFSDLSRAKRRPALVPAAVREGDLSLCQITSRAVTDGYAVALDETDFRSGSLRKPSNIRPNRLFTADGSLVLYRVGQLAAGKTAAVIDALVAILKA